MNSREELIAYIMRLTPEQEAKIMARLPEIKAAIQDDEAMQKFIDIIQREETQ